MKRILRHVPTLALLLFAAVAQADDWREEMWERPVTLRKGLSVRAYVLSEPRLMKAYVARVDLTTPGIAFTSTGRAANWGEVIKEYTESKCVAETKCETTVDFMNRRRKEGLDVAIAFNTTPWKPYPPPEGVDSCDLQGWNVADGVEVSAHAQNEALFLVRKDGTCSIVPSLSPGEEGEIAFAANAFDIIMTNGVDVAAVRRDENEPPKPRLALGLADGGNTLVILAIDGRQDLYSLGTTHSDLRALLRREGVTDAVNMDGGGSTSLVVFNDQNNESTMLNRHKSNRLRANASNFGIVLPPCVPSEVERTSSVFHSYEFEKTEDTPPPEGFHPFYISHYGRHGSRRLTRTYVADVLTILESNPLTPEGEALLRDMRRIAETHDNMIGQLSIRGAREHRILARRMATRFPEVFRRSRRVRCRATPVPRVLSSMANFTTALKECAPSISLDCSTGEKFHRLLCQIAWSRSDEDHKRERRAAKDFAKEIVYPKPLAERLFMPEAKIEYPFSFVHDLFVCASACQCLESELDGLSIYRYFTSGEISSLGRALATEHYAGMGNSAEFGHIAAESAKLLLRDFVTRVDSAIADDRVAADLRFGHDSGLWPLAVLMALEGPDVKVPIAEAYDACPGWKWMPMAANLQLVLYRHKDGSILAKVLYNEREIRIRGLESYCAPYYPWQSLKTFWQERLK